MKTKFFLMLILTTFIALRSFAGVITTAVVHTETHVSNFHQLTVYGNVNVTLTQGEQPAVMMQGTQKSIEVVKLTQAGDELIIRKKDGAANDLTVYVTVNDLTSIYVEDNAQVKCATPLHTQSLSILLKGKGDVRVNSDAQKVITVSNGEGRICVEGDFNSSVTRIDSYHRLITAYCKN